MMMDVNETYCGDHFITYINMETCTLETNVIGQLYLNEIIKLRAKRKKKTDYKTQIPWIYS